jgi:outer membrane protein assembly factor BamB
MKPALVEKGIPALCGVAATAALALWVGSFYAPTGIRDRPLGLEKPPTPQATTNPNVDPPKTNPQTTVVSPNPGVVATDLPGNWPGFRGPGGDNICKDSGPLNRDWAKQPPRAFWSIDLGEGYAGAAVSKGRVFVLDYDMTALADTLRCLSLADGKEIWKRSYPVVVKRYHGMSRTVPAVTDKYVVTLGPKCHVMCCDLAGNQIWFKDLVAEYGATVPEWYAGQCPLIDGDKVILAPGGKALMIAVDLATGKVLWKSPNPRNWLMTHSSILATTIGGQKTYVYCGSGGIAGVSAKDGSILWDSTEWVISTATVATPVPIGDGRLFLSGGYESGAMMIKPEGKSAKVLWKVAPAVFGSEQQTPILYQGHIYGVIPNGQLVCLDLDGKQVWRSGEQTRFGLGPYVMADGLIYVLNDSGTLSMVEANPKTFRKLGDLKILAGPDAWGPMAVAGGRLIARDLTKMICIDVARH